jgi:anti-sigma B factor antagonist
MHNDNRLTTQHHGDYSQLTLRGEFDLACSDVLREALHDALEGCSGDRLLVDLSGVEFVDSTALGTLVGAHHHATRLGVHLILTSAPPRVQKLLDITQINRLITTHPSVQAALGVAGEPPKGNADFPSA